MGRLNGKISIVTGGAQGIGFATVEKFAREGSLVIFWDVNAHKGQAVIKELQAKQLSVNFQEVNVAQLSSTDTAAKQVIEKYGRIDILVNNAGILRDATLLKMASTDWQQVIDVNLTGVFNCVKSIAPYMVQQKFGRIINVSSIVGLYGSFGQTNYVASKSGIIGLTKVWARELGRKGITVNAVAPGFIATEMVKTMPDKVLRPIIEKTPLRRLGTPEDIAYAFLFLASDDAAFINGIVLSVDGGLVV